jgi:hypothetical protein
MRFFGASSCFLTGRSTGARCGSNKAKSSRDKLERMRFGVLLQEGFSGTALPFGARAPAVSQASAPKKRADDDSSLLLLLEIA